MGRRRKPKEPRDDPTQPLSTPPPTQPTPSRRTSIFIRISQWGIGTLIGVLIVSIVANLISDTLPNPISIVVRWLDGKPKQQEPATTSRSPISSTMPPVNPANPSATIVKTVSYGAVPPCEIVIDLDSVLFNFTWRYPTSADFTEEWKKVFYVSHNKKTDLPFYLKLDLNGDSFPDYAWLLVAKETGLSAKEQAKFGLFYILSNDDATYDVIKVTEEFHYSVESFAIERVPKGYFGSVFDNGSAPVLRLKHDGVRLDLLETELVILTFWDEETHKPKLINLSYDD